MSAAAPPGAPAPAPSAAPTASRPSPGRPCRHRARHPASSLRAASVWDNGAISAGRARLYDGTHDFLSRPTPAATPAKTLRAPQVLLAAPRGYCAGVDRAVIAVEKALEQYGAPVYVRHEIVHNKYVVKTLEKKGAIFVDETEEVPEGDIVIFSAHGVAPVVHEEAERGKLATIDATCPLVTKVHKEAVRYAKEDYDILLIGHEGHEEVVGTSGEAPDHITLVDGPDDVAQRRGPRPGRRSSGSPRPRSRSTRRWRPSTPSRAATRNLLSPPSDDICYATQNRQIAVKQMGAEADLVIVVGSKNSSNSVRLVEVALGAGARDAHLVDYADEIDEAWLEGVTTVGVTSGASVPESSSTASWSGSPQRGYEDVETVTAAEESINFSLPKELRRDLRAEAQAAAEG